MSELEPKVLQVIGDLEVAIEAGADIIGINNRNLSTLKVDTGTTMELMGVVPEGKIVVSESGHRTRADIELLEDAGVDAVLIGEAIMRSEDVGAKVRELLGASSAGDTLLPRTDLK